MKIRQASLEDKKELIDIWKQIFHDDDLFTNWYFDNHFRPKYSTVCEINGKIISCVHSRPVTIVLNSKEITANFIAGVSTNEDFRGKGLMKETIMAHNKRMCDGGALISILKAVDPNIYKCLGYEVVTKEQFVYLSTGNKCLNNEFDYVKNVDVLFKCYDSFITNSIGCLKRTRADFIIKFKEYELSGYKCIAIQNNNHISGYAVCCIEDNKLYAEECVAEDLDAYEKLIKLLNETSFSEIKVRIPSKKIIGQESFGISALELNKTKISKLYGINNIYECFDDLYIVDEY